MQINPRVVFTFRRQWWRSTTFRFNLPYLYEHQIKFFTRLLCLFLHLNSILYIMDAVKITSFVKKGNETLYFYYNWILKYLSASYST
jgi:hypothetical protein